MKRANVPTTVRLLCAALCLAAMGGIRAQAADEVGVYVGGPGSTTNYVQDAAAVRRQLAGAKARWDAAAVQGATFTMAVVITDKEHTALPRCYAVPITVQVKQGQRVSATYAESTAKCAAGSPVNPADDPAAFALLSPDFLFQHVSSLAERGVRGQACIQATFDDDYGLPTEVEEGCPWLADSKAKIQISGIVGVERHFWYVAGTVAAVLVGLLSLVFYHLTRDRRRVQKMPDLFLR